MKKAIFLLLIPFFFATCNNMTKPNYPGENEIILEWEFKGSHVSLA